MPTTKAGTVSIADALCLVLPDGPPFRFTAYDGSACGPENAAVGLELLNSRGLSYLLTAPGYLGFVRAYVAGDLALHGTHPGDPYDVMVLMMTQLHARVPSPAQIGQIVRSLGLGVLKPPPPPPQEELPRWRRTVAGLRHTKSRDKSAIHHHYDLSNTFYSLLLGPSMTYSCAVFENDQASLEQAQTAKYDLIARKLALEPGQRLFDLGCGWGGMVRHAAAHYGVKALGVTLSQQQANWASEAVRRDRLADRVEIRFLDYRDVSESGFDAVSSIGVAEHIGVANYPSHFRWIFDHLKPGGRLLNHCITRPTTRRQEIGAFMDRYVFPDGELAGVGRIVSDIQNQGFEVRHVEDLREHYPRTLAGWSANLQQNWDACVAEVGLATAKVWGVYIAGSRIAFSRNEIQLDQVLAVRPDSQGNSGFGLRPAWGN